MIKKFFIILFIFFSITLHAEEYTKFIEEQMEYLHQMNDVNITKENMQSLVKNQEQSYLAVLDYIMSNKQEYLDEPLLYSSEIVTLKKMIKINERARNKYSIMRDEVQLKSYMILRNQQTMIKDVLIALNTLDMKIFRETLNNVVVKNQLENNKYMDIDYRALLETDEDKMPTTLKTNIQEFYDLLDINTDVITHLYTFEKKMYRLNKYSKYHLIGSVIYVNQTEFGKLVNPYLEKVNLSVIKIGAIFVLSLTLYLLKIVLQFLATKLFGKIDGLEKYSEDIIEQSTSPITFLLAFINMEFVIYIYNDFISIDKVGMFFNIVYTALLVWYIYRILNIMTNKKIDEIEQFNKQIKHELINVGRKIMNFLIILIGVLLILYLGGVDLTAVLSGLGIGGLAVALAAKESLSNFFGTLSILLSDVFSQGDWIVVNGEEGVVIEIGLRVTTLRTFDNALIAIPNATLANNDVKNWNKRTLGRRIKMNLAVKYSSKSEDIKNAVNEIRIMLDAHPQIATKNTKFTYRSLHGTRLVSKDDLQGVKKNLLVYLDEFSSSSINILVYCFTKSVDWEEWLQTKEDVMHKIMAIFEQNNLEFAFPSMSIYHENKIEESVNSDL